MSQKLLNQYYPLPNVNNPGGSYNYETLQPTPATTNGWDVRLDHYITSNQQIYARFSWKNLNSDTVNPLLPDDINVEHDRSFLVSYNYTISPKMVNEFRFGFTNSLIDTDLSHPGRGGRQRTRPDRHQLRQSPDDRSVSDLQFFRRHRVYADRPRQGRARRLANLSVHR